VQILLITGWFPYPPDNGARMRVYYLLRELARRHQVHLLSFTRDSNGAPGVEVPGCACRVLGTVPFREFAPYGVRALLGLFSTHPRSLQDTYSPTMHTLVRRALDQGHYDLILASEIGPGSCTSRYVADVDSIPRVVEDLELSMIRSKISAQRTSLGRLRHRLTWWKLRRYIAALLQRMEGCTVASERERRVVLDLVPGHRWLAVVPNGVDLAQYRGDFGPAEPETLVFTGALTYEANHEAMQFFLSEVFPHIRAARPGVTLRITGRTDGADLERLPVGEGVILTGYLEDVRPAVARSAVCVAPLTTGGGTRVKILEAMVLGTPVVSTSKGAEGLEVTPGEDILIADDPRAFADAVLGVLGDAGLRARLAENGKQLVKERYDWRRIGDHLDDFIQQVVDGSRE